MPMGFRKYRAGGEGDLIRIFASIPGRKAGEESSFFHRKNRLPAALTAWDSAAVKSNVSEIPVAHQMLWRNLSG